jgi:hypothetical protein
MAKEIENVSYFKIEVPQAAVKVRELNLEERPLWGHGMVKKPSR